MYQKPSSNQQKCYVHHEPFAITYVKDIPHNPIKAAIDVIDVVEILRPVFEITSADLRLGCARKGDHQWDIKINPPETGWHIRCSNLPKETQPAREFGSSGFAPNFEVATLSKPILIDWVKKAFNQKCPNSEIYDLSWFEFDFNTVRTKIFTEELLVGQSMMKTIHERPRSCYESEYPLIEGNGQLWVYSPLADLRRFSAFKIYVNHIDWQEIMELNLYVGWSWWTQLGFKECDVLLKTIPQIEALGWDLEFFADLDAFYIPREA